MFSEYPVGFRTWLFTSTILDTVKTSEHSNGLIGNERMESVNRLIDWESVPEGGLINYLPSALMPIGLISFIVFNATSEGLAVWHAESIISSRKLGEYTLSMPFEAQMETIVCGITPAPTIFVVPETCNLDCYSVVRAYP